jgi:hypothetical protein
VKIRSSGCLRAQLGDEEVRGGHLSWRRAFLGRPEGSSPARATRVGTAAQPCRPPGERRDGQSIEARRQPSGRICRRPAQRDGRLRRFTQRTRITGCSGVGPGHEPL